MELFIFRHGETFETKNGSLPYGPRVESAQILPEAIPVIKRLGKYLKNIKTDTNYTSPYLRCIQTVEIVTEVSKKVFLVEDRLSEYRPEKETLDELIARVEEFFKYLKSQKLDSAAICTHGFPISVLTQLATKGFVRKHEMENYPKPGELTIIKNCKKGIVDFN